MTADETSSTTFEALVTETKVDPIDPISRSVESGDRISVNYRGWLASTGEVFDQSFIYNKTLTFTVGQNVIKGWSDGVLGMKVGEVRRLKIPSELGYGEAGSEPKIPANADLIFDVELVKFN